MVFWISGSSDDVLTGALSATPERSAAGGPSAPAAPGSDSPPVSADEGSEDAADPGDAEGSGVPIADGAGLPGGAFVEGVARGLCATVGRLSSLSASLIAPAADQAGRGASAQSTIKPAASDHSRRIDGLRSL